MFSIFPQDDQDQTLRIKRFLMACGAYIIWGVLCFVGYSLGLTKVLLINLVAGVLACSVVNVLLYVIFRKGLNKRFKDPSLTLLQMLIATFWIMVVVYYAYEARSAILLVYMVVLVFGFFRLNVRQFLFLSGFALVNYSAIIFILYKIQPENLNMRVDMFNIVVLACILPWYALIGGYITKLRTQISHALSAVRKSEENFRRSLDDSPLGVRISTIDGETLYANRAVLDIYGFDNVEELQKTSVKDRYTSETYAEFLIRKEKRLKGEPVPSEYEISIRRKNGEIRKVHVFRKEIFWNGQKQSQVLYQDITERKQMEEQINYLATHDVLTGLSNRLLFSQLLSHAIQSAQRRKRQIAVLFVDLDRFKMINDSMGHEAGDQLLQEMAKRFKQSLRTVDVVGRLGGDEFIIMIEDVDDLNQVAGLAHKILSSTMKPVVLLGEECRITASVGISVYPKDGQDEKSLMKNADTAMYFAKEEGRNNYQFFSENIQSTAKERLSIETNLRCALERNELYLNYQAELEFKTGKIKGVEALLRWNNPYLGSITPTQLIPIAEETGLIIPIGRWVMKTACAQNVAWQRQGLPPVCMSINLSHRQLLDENLINDIKAALEESGMAPELLELEITECMLMNNPPRMIEVLNKIKELGVRIAIDNFGTGYSSLAQIRHFPVDTLKVDRSFIRNVPQDDEDKAITEAIINLGKHLSVTVIAEGVETEIQDDYLRKKFCDEMQGFYFSKPISPEKFADLLSKHKDSSQK
ncbi:MAG: EAL domain-containing protein [Syntrophaceae bacterium]|nr:EAL domain-containing protein [Syntrophaceae bacterium]